MVYICNLSPELQKKAKEELNEDPERRQDDIDHIQEWLKKQPHINARTDDKTILCFLRGCKFSLQRTKEKLDMFYTCKGLAPEWFSNRDPLDPKMKAILELGLIMPLPCGLYSKRDCRVIIGRPGMRDVKVTDMNDLFKTMILVNDIVNEDERSSIAGTEVIIDFTDFTFSHAAQVTVPLVKKSSVIIQDGYPMRPKGIHYINTPQAFDTVFNIFKTFMKEKMRKRVHIHGSDLESLHKYFSKDILPIEYGGTNGSIEEVKNYWIDKVIEHREWLLEDEKYKVDESKRPGNPKTSSELFGVEGSFRMLNVD